MGKEPNTCSLAIPWQARKVCAWGTASPSTDARKGSWGRGDSEKAWLQRHRRKGRRCKRHLSAVSWGATDRGLTLRRHEQQKPLGQQWDRPSLSLFSLSSLSLLHGDDATSPPSSWAVPLHTTQDTGSVYCHGYDPICQNLVSGTLGRSPDPAWSDSDSG